MIHWAWLIVAGVLGGSFGAMSMMLIIAGDTNDD